MAKKKKRTYSEAFNEAQEILSEIENDNIDVDTLSSKVKHAAELLQFCKSKLSETESEVEKIFESISE